MVSASKAFTRSAPVTGAFSYGPRGRRSFTMKPSFGGVESATGATRSAPLLCANPNEPQTENTRTQAIFMAIHRVHSANHGAMPYDGRVVLFLRSFRDAPKAKCYCSNHT